MSKQNLAPTYELRPYAGQARVQMSDPGAAEAVDSMDLMIYDTIVNDDFWGGVTAKAVAEQLAAARNAKQINVRINSAGGSVFDAMAIHNALTRHPAHVDVHVDGMALSSASVVAMAGDRIHIAENAMMMVHEPWSAMAGSASELRHEADVLDKIGQTVAATYAARSKLKAEDLPAIMAAETWYTADEAVAAGLADEVTAAKRIAAHADLTRFRNTPAKFAATIETPRTAPVPEKPAMKERIAKLAAADPQAWEAALADEYARGKTDGRQAAAVEAETPPAPAYMEAFGEARGALFFAKATPFPEAQRLYAAELAEELAAAGKAVSDREVAMLEQQTAHAAALADLKAQMAALRGEEAPIDTPNANKRGADKRPKSLADLVRVRQ